MLKASTGDSLRFVSYLGSVFVFFIGKDMTLFSVQWLKLKHIQVQHAFRFTRQKVCRNRFLFWICPKTSFNTLSECWPKWRYPLIYLIPRNNRGRRCKHDPDRGTLRRCLQGETFFYFGGGGGYYFSFQP